MRFCLALAVAGLLLVTASANADYTGTYGWEDGGTVLGTYSDIICTNVGAPDPVHSGERSLKLEDAAASGTPQAFVAWITGLLDGDVVTGSFWRYDVTPGASPSGRIWGHYSDNVDPGAYLGSASGNSDYGPGLGWDETSYVWTFDGSDPLRTALTIEARTYSNPGDTIWVDDISVTVPDHATIHFAPEPASLALLALGGLALLRRR